MKNKKFIFATLIFLISLPVFSSLSFGRNGVIDVEIISSTDNKVEGRIKNFSNYAKELELDKIVITGTKKVSNNTTNIEWSELSLNNKTSLISSDFKSKIIVKEQGVLTKGDSFKAKGNYNHLASAIEDLLGKDSGNALNSGQTTASGLENQSSYGEGGYSTSGQSSSTGLNQTTPNAVPDSKLGESTITNQGCRPRVDYELNQVYIQQRVLLNGSQIESCSDSMTSFKLEKDYNSCPVDISLSAKEISYFYQYFYTDANSAVNVIGNCEKDPLKTKPLQIIKDYEPVANPKSNLV